MSKRRLMNIDVATLCGLTHSLNITNTTGFRNFTTDVSRMMFYFEMHKWCMENIGEENFQLTSEYTSPGLPADWYIHTATEEDLTVFKLKYVKYYG